MVLTDANVSAIGAALLGGMAIGTYSSDSDAVALGLATDPVGLIVPDEDQEAYAEAYLRYVELYPGRSG